MSRIAKIKKSHVIEYLNNHPLFDEDGEFFMGELGKDHDPHFGVECTIIKLDNNNPIYELHVSISDFYFAGYKRDNLGKIQSFNISSSWQEYIMAGLDRGSIVGDFSTYMREFLFRDRIVPSESFINVDY